MTRTRNQGRPLGNQAAIIFLAVSMLLLPSCLMMFNGSDQNLGLSSNPGGAKVVVNDAQNYTTPATIRLARNTNHTLVFEKDGYQSAAQSVSSSLNGFFFLDVLIWGPFALLDFTNGSAYKLSSENVDVTLVPKPATMNAAPTAPAATSRTATSVVR